MNLFDLFLPKQILPSTFPRTVGTWTVARTGAPAPATRVFRAPPEKPAGLYQLVAHVQRLVSGSAHAHVYASWRTAGGEPRVEPLASLDLGDPSFTEKSGSIYTTIRADTNVEFYVDYLGSTGSYRVRGAVIHVATFGTTFDLPGA